MTLAPLELATRLVVAAALGSVIGLERERFRRLTGRHPEDALNRAALDRLTAEGYLVCDAAGVRVTTRGRPCLDHLSATLLC